MEKQRRRKNKRLSQLFSATLMLAVVCLLVAFVPVVSADWNDAKSFDKNDGEYGKIKIKDWLFLAKADYKLTGYDASIINVWAEGDYELHKKTHLFTGVFYKDTVGNRGDLRDVQFYIWEGTTETKERIIYEQVNCVETENPNSTNGTMITTCDTEQTTEEYTINNGEWIPYEKDTKLGIGIGKWRMEAKRPINQKVDFILEAHGKEFTEWAWWNASWEFKRTISSLDGNISGLYTITKDDNMRDDFGDVRFTNTNGDTELNYGFAGGYDPEGLAYSSMTSRDPIGYDNVSTNGLVSYWKLDDDVLDAHGSDDLTATSGGYDAGKINNGSDFTSNNERTGPSWNDVPDGVIVDDDFAMSMWIKTPSSFGTVNQYIFDTNAGFVIDWKVSSSGVLNVVLGSDTSTNYQLATSTWYHIVLDRDQSEATGNLYINGVAHDAFSGTGTGNPSTITMGSWNDGGDNFWTGMVDEVAIYNRTLTLNEIFQMYDQGLKNGLVSYYKLDNNDLTDAHNSYNLTNSGTTNTSGFIIDGRSFDGTNDDLSVGSFSGLEATDTYSVGMWFNSNDITQEEHLMGIYYSANSRLSLGMKNSYLGFNSYDGDLNEATRSTTTLNSNEWYYVTITHHGDDNSNEMYLNGILQTGDTPGLAYAGAHAGVLYIGQRENGFLYWNGTIDEIGIWNRILSQTDVTNLYNAKEKAFRVDNLGASSIDMYYGNPSATTTEDIAAVYFNPVSVYFFDKNTKDFIRETFASATAGAPFMSDGFINGSIEFDGTDDNIQIPMPLTDGTATFGAWFKSNELGSFRSIMQTQGTGFVDFKIYIGADNIPYCDYGDGSSWAPVYADFAITADTWYNVFCTVDGSNIKMYFNGLLNDTDTGGNLDVDDPTLFIGSSDVPSGWFNGSIDEIMFWDRALTADEVYRIASQTAPSFSLGAEVSINSLSIELTLPADNYTTNSATTTFECNASDTVNNVLNLDLYINGSSYEEVATEGDLNLTLSSVETLADGYWTWYCYADTVDTSINSTTRSLTVDSTFPTLVIAGPATLNDYLTPGTNVTINSTITDTKLDTCWYDYNTTNTTITGCATGVLNSSTFATENGNYNVTVWANDTMGNTNSSFYSWSYQIVNNSNTYNATAMVGETQTFQTNVTANTSLTSVTLDYGGTGYLLASQGGGIYNTSITIPTGTAGVNTLRYNYTYAGSVIQGEEFNQTVTDMILAECNATYTDVFANFTFANENNATVIPGALPTATFVYYLDDSDVNKTLSISNSTEALYWDLCSNVGFRNLTADYRIQYESTGYPQRVSEPTPPTWSNDSVTPTVLYLLPTADGIYVTFQVVDSTDALITGVVVEAKRLVSSVLTTVADGTTDASGAVTMWLNPDFSHTFTFTHASYDTLTSTFAPTQSSYTIILGGGVTTSGVEDYVKAVTYTIKPTADTILYTNNVYVFNMTMNSSYWNLTSWGFNLYNTSGTLLGSSTTTGNTGSTSTSLNVTTAAAIELKYYWLINTTYSNATRTFLVYSSGGTDWSINNTLTDFNTYFDQGMFGMTPFAMSLIVFLFLTMFVGVMSWKFGLVSPTAISMMMFFVVLFLDVGLDIMKHLNPAGNEHFITFFVGLVMISMLFRELAR